jgi:hypothetical protein
VTTDEREIEEEAQSVAWWLDEKNSQARKELEQRQPELGQWLSMIEKRVDEKLAQVEQEGEMKV